MLLTKINVHVLTISISCQHPISVLSIVVILLSSLFCCSIVQSTALFYCVVYFVLVLFPSLSHCYCPVYCVILVSSLLCFPVYQGIPLSILLHDYFIVQSMALFFCLVYCVMLLSSLLCCSVYSIVQFILHFLLLGLQSVFT